MSNYMSKDLKVAIKKDIKKNDNLVKALTEDEKQYGDNNQQKIKALKEINSKLNELLKLQ